MRVYYHSRISSNYYYHTLTLNKDYIYVELHELQSYSCYTVTLLQGCNRCNRM